MLTRALAPWLLAACFLFPSLMAMAAAAVPA